MTKVCALLKPKTHEDTYLPADPCWKEYEQFERASVAYLLNASKAAGTASEPLSGKRGGQGVHQLAEQGEMATAS
jgi:hypothetical protein